jgi:hypothetical protein
VLSSIEFLSDVFINASKFHLFDIGSIFTVKAETTQVDMEAKIRGRRFEWSERLGTCIVTCCFVRLARHTLNLVKAVSSFKFQIKHWATIFWNPRPSAGHTVITLEFWKLRAWSYGFQS